MTWQPTWRRLIASTLICFVLVLALLTWRVRTGEDPALRADTRAAGVTTTVTAPATDDDGAGESALPSTGAS
jgi:hypothetical protein